jgi:hypothetical protein
MKKSAFPAALLLTLTGLSGCPIYEHDDAGCFDDLDCAYGYLCDGATGACYAPQDSGIACDEPSDCGTNETCSRTGSCAIGDCHFPSVGCVQGYVCSAEDGRWMCVSEAEGQGGAPASGGADGSGGAESNGGVPASGGAGANAGEPAASGASNEAGSPAASGGGAG